MQSIDSISCEHLNTLKVAYSLTDLNENRVKLCHLEPNIPYNGRNRSQNSKLNIYRLLPGNKNLFYHFMLKKITDIVSDTGVKYPSLLVTGYKILRSPAQLCHYVTTRQRLTPVDTRPTLPWSQPGLLTLVSIPPVCTTVPLVVAMVVEQSCLPLVHTSGYSGHSGTTLAS